MSTTKPANQITIGPVRFSYAHVFTPFSFDNDPSKAQYSVCVLIDKKDTKTIDKVQNAIDYAMDQGKTSKWNGSIPNNLWFPLRDGDDEKEGDPAYKGKLFLNAKTKTQPTVVDRQVQRIIDPNEFYSGCYGNVSLSFYPFSASGNKGVGVGLRNIQKTRDGERFGGGSSAEDDFTVLSDDEIDAFF